MTIVVTGSASGIGAATAARLTADGQRVIGVDIHDADVVADLGTAEGRRTAVEKVTAECVGTLSGVVACAGLGGTTERAGSLLASVNYFGAVATLDGLRPLLAANGGGAAVAISSNSTTILPNWSTDLADACLAGDEPLARERADAVGANETYAATKAALARWVRRQATTPEWIGAGIRLNAIAPGLVTTPLSDEIRRDPVLGSAIDSFPIPAGRPGRPEEIAAFIAYLLSDEASFFVGSLLFIDGGSDAMLRPDDVPQRWVLGGLD
jgi:NAD(P)-dependent dehydrogenase (short-subunit alcohol dehydrogenase family)